MTGCHKRGPLTVAEGALEAGYYKGRLERDDDRERKFRLLLFVAAPDRIHAEILSPLGNPQLIVDGGGGRMAVTFVREGVSFVGDASPAVFDRLFGLELGLDLGQWVAAVRGGLEHPTLSFKREGSGALPERLEIEGGEERLTLELRRRQPVPVDAGRLGRGLPPTGTELRPLDELLRQPERLEMLDAEPPPT